MFGSQKNLSNLDIHRSKVTNRPRFNERSSTGVPRLGTSFAIEISATYVNTMNFFFCATAFLGLMHFARKFGLHNQAKVGGLLLGIFVPLLFQITCDPIYFVRWCR